MPTTEKKHAGNRRSMLTTEGVCWLQRKNAGSSRSMPAAAVAATTGARRQQREHAGNSSSMPAAA
eukprot:357818-Chlamydomonas_euryale.AAC.5